MATYHEKRQELIANYSDKLKEIGKLNPMPNGVEPDDSVALTMLVANYKANKAGEASVYAMPATWTNEDYVKFGKAYDDVINYELAF